jgi:hypothetical protein
MTPDVTIKTESMLAEDVTKTEPSLWPEWLHSFFLPDRQRRTALSSLADSSNQRPDTNMYHVVQNGWNGAGSVRCDQHVDQFIPVLLGQFCLVIRPITPIRIKVRLQA